MRVSELPAVTRTVLHCTEKSSVRSHPQWVTTLIYRKRKDESPDVGNPCSTLTKLTPLTCAAEIAHVLLLAYGLPLLLLPSGRSNRAKAGPRLSSSPSDCSYSPIPHPTSLSASSPCSSIPPEALLYTGQLPTCAFVDTGEKSLPENTGNGREGECRDEVSGLCSYTAQGS